MKKTKKAIKGKEIIEQEINLKEKESLIIEAQFTDESCTTDNHYFIDNPCDEKNDSIGFSVYVDSIISAINSKAKMIGLISNFGSGKTTVLNMVKERVKFNKEIKMCKINLWNLPSEKNTKPQTDATIDIHKSLLNQLINNSSFVDNEKKSLRKQINKNYNFIDFVLEDNKLVYGLYLIFSLFIFNVIMKMEIGGFTVPRIGIFILDLCFAINLIYILSKSKFYFSFNKEKTIREIDENETIECFSKIVSLHKKYKVEHLIICIEDIDRFTNKKSDAIKFLEQVYKFYNESISFEGINVTFIITIKPAYYFANEVEIDDQNDTIKDIYEKIFDYILNLNTVAIQNYDALLKELLKPKEKLLQNLGIDLPGNKNTFYWTYLYKGNKITVRDIKHRYNYALNLYNNLHNQISGIEDSDININIETCFYVSYLEDEFSACFYQLVQNSQNFEKMVTNYLMNGNLNLCSKCDDTKNCIENESVFNCPFIKEKELTEFIESLKYGLDNGLIDSDFTMYFYKYPKGKKVKNVYDAGINSMLLKDKIDKTNDFEKYVKNSSESEIINTIRILTEANRIPNIIFKSLRLYELTYDYFQTVLNKHIVSYDILKDEKKTLLLIENLSNLGSSKAQDSLLLLINHIAPIIKENKNSEEILSVRKIILNIISNYPNIYKKLFELDFPAITKSEMDIIANINRILEITNSNHISESLIADLNAMDKSKLEINIFISFISKCIVIDKNMFKNLFYIFKPSDSNFSNADKYKILKINNVLTQLELTIPQEIIKFFKHYNFVPSELEDVFLSNITGIDSIEQEKLIEEYVNLIKDTNHISAKAMSFFGSYNTWYDFTEKIEDELYKKNQFRTYIFSMANRTSKLILEEEKKSSLENEYIYYLINSNKVGKEVFPTFEMLEFLFPKVEKLELEVERRNLFNDIPQTYANVDYILKNKDAAYINSYLIKIKTFLSSDNDEIFKLIYDWAYNSNLMNVNTYEHIKGKINRGNRTKFGVLKKKNKLV